MLGLLGEFLDPGLCDVYAVVMNMLWLYGYKGIVD